MALFHKVSLRTVIPTFLALSLFLLRQPLLVEAGCGCDKPPPEPAAVIPRVAFPGLPVTVSHSSFRIGQSWNFIFRSGTKTKNVTASVIARRALTDPTGATYEPQVVVTVPDIPVGPASITASSGAVFFAVPQDAFTVIARRLARGGAQFLVNISNDHWLSAGGAAAAEQHFALAVFRAVENRRFLVRAAAQGISGFVDPTGRRVQLSTAPEGAMMAQVTPRHELTLYTQYGDWFFYVCAGCALFAILRRRSPTFAAEAQP